MPLSEHEQRMLDEIETALAEEDPKFVSNVRGGRLRGASHRRRLLAAALFIVGLALLVGGLALQAGWIGQFPVVSLVGFVVMFSSGVLLLLGGGADPTAPDVSFPAAAGGKKRRGPRAAKTGGIGSRMEERFRKRFDR